MFKINQVKNKSTLAILAYVLFAFLVLLVLKKLYFPNLFNEVNFLNWDAEHYHWIKDKGYEGFRIAFFPFFPIMWKILALQVYGVVFFNAFLYLFSFYMLIKTLQIKTKEALLYLSIPSSIFYFLPYTEAIFFAASTLILIGLIKSRLNFVLLGLFICSLTRPSFIFFIPAILMLDFYNGKLNLTTFTKSFLKLGILFLGLAFVFALHAYYTGNWFAYFENSKGWGGGIFQFPKLPFTSWAGGLIVRLDGAALFFGVLAGIMLLAFLFKASLLKGKKVSDEVFFSFAFLSGLTVFLIMRGGTLFSLNRFLFATPFFIIAFHFWLKLELVLSAKKIVILFILSLNFWLLFGSYVHVQTLLKFVLLSIYLCLIFTLKVQNKKIASISIYLLIGINVCFQLYFYIRFLQGEWVG